MADKRAAKFGRAGVSVTGDDPLVSAMATKQLKKTYLQRIGTVSPAPWSGRMLRAATPIQSRTSSSTHTPPPEGPHGVEVPEGNPPCPPPKRMKTAVVKEYITRQIIIDGKVVKTEESHNEYLTQIEVDEAGMPINGTKHL